MVGRSDSVISIVPLSFLRHCAQPSLQRRSLTPNAPKGARRSSLQRNSKSGNYRIAISRAAIVVAGVILDGGLCAPNPWRPIRDRRNTAPIKRWRKAASTSNWHTSFASGGGIARRTQSEIEGRALSSSASAQRALRVYERCAGPWPGPLRCLQSPRSGAAAEILQRVCWHTSC